MVYTEVANAIMLTDSSGLLINFGLTQWLSVETALTVYTWLSIIAILIWSGYASKLTESRFAITTIFLAMFLVWIGWLRSPLGSEGYWGTLLMLLLLALAIFFVDAYREQHGPTPPGSLALRIAMFVVSFNVALGIATSGYLIPNYMSTGAAGDNPLCSQFTCDETGHITIDAKVTEIAHAGSGGIVSDLSFLTTGAISMVILLLSILKSCLLTYVVILQAFPFLGDYPAALAILAIFNVVSVIAFVLTIFNILAKPANNAGDV